MEKTDFALPIGQDFLGKTSGLTDLAPGIRATEIWDIRDRQRISPAPGWTIKMISEGSLFKKIIPIGPESFIATRLSVHGAVVGGLREDISHRPSPILKIHLYLHSFLISIILSSSPINCKLSKKGYAH